MRTGRMHMSAPCVIVHESFPEARAARAGYLAAAISYAYYMAVVLRSGVFSLWAARDHL